MSELESRRDGHGTYSRYSPEAWLVACESSAERSARRRARFRRYQFRLYAGLFGLIAFWAAIVFAFQRLFMG